MVVATVSLEARLKEATSLLDYGRDREGTRAATGGVNSDEYVVYI